MSKAVFRVGRKLGRTIYMQRGEEPSDADMFLGIMDSRLMAATIVRLLNTSAPSWLEPPVYDDAYDNDGSAMFDGTTTRRPSAWPSVPEWLEANRSQTAEE